MAQITYRGPVETLQGTSWQVPDSVLQAGQGAAWVESQHRQQLAEEAAKQEADQRQQELLAARIEAQRLAAEADAATTPAVEDTYGVTPSTAGSVPATTASTTVTATRTRTRAAHDYNYCECNNCGWGGG